MRQRGLFLFTLVSVQNGEHGSSGGEGLGLAPQNLPGAPTDHEVYIQTPQMPWGVTGKGSRGVGCRANRVSRLRLQIDLQVQELHGNGGQITGTTQH